MRFGRDWQNLSIGADVFEWLSIKGKNSMEIRFNNGFILGVILIAAGVSGRVLLNNNIMQDAFATEEWPSTTGVILEASIEPTSQNSDPIYAPNVVYEYTVRGDSQDEQYKSDRIAIYEEPMQSNMKRIPESVVEPYQQGDIVEVYFNPKNPSDSLLEPGPTRFLNWLYRGCLLIALLGGYIIFRRLRFIARWIMGIIRGR